MYLKLNFLSSFVASTFDWLKGAFRKFSTGVANINRETAVTRMAPVPTNVCFSSLTTGLTCKHHVNFGFYHCLELLPKFLMEWID